MMRYYSLLLVWVLATATHAQTNIFVTDGTATDVLQGNYNPAQYAATQVIDLPSTVTQGINSRISPDSLKAYLMVLSDFQTRNTGSDTLSQTRGIGAARRWIHRKFADFSQRNESRLLPAYLQFDDPICGVTQHRNTLAVLPGTDPTAGIVLIEGHMDSRCQTACDTACLAEGMEDNGSGTALVIELARVMSRYTYKHTLVFMATTGEEQGLHGATAFAEYCVQQGIPIRAVLNNDIVGGIICGETASAPGCSGLDAIDSTQVRIYSAGSWGSPSKGLARFIKLQYQEELLPHVTVPMLVTLMSGEDRSGRGGDHIPFRQRGFQSVRFTSAHEHGDASNGPDYHDRQHTHRDILGVDTDGDNELDSFFVDFNYLARNAAINANAATMAALGPVNPTFTTSQPFGGVIRVTIQDPQQYGAYRVGFRTGANDFDSLYYTTDTTLDITVENNGFYYLSVAAVDSNGVESIFDEERRELVTRTAVTEPQDLVVQTHQNIFLHQNRPNPFDEATYIGFEVKAPVEYHSAYLSIVSIDGKEIERIPVELQLGPNEVLYTHGYGVQGVYLYSLYVDGRHIDSKRMIFAF